jgi:hypothetical protein
VNTSDLLIRALRGELRAHEPPPPEPAPRGGLPLAVARWKAEQDAAELEALMLATTPSPEFDAAAPPKE